MYAAYNENEIGALDCDEIEGYIAPDSDLVLQCAVEFEKQQNQNVSTRNLFSKDKYQLLFFCTG